MNDEQPTPVNVQSGYGAKTQAPFVELQIGDYAIQMAPPKAREIAMLLLEAAEASETDALVMSIFYGNEPVGVQLLSVFRNWRAGRSRAGAAVQTAQQPDV